MRSHHPQYLELPIPVHADEHGRSAHQAGHRHWLLIVGLILLAMLLIGVSVTGGGR
jgi:hypothetical protein